MTSTLSPEHAESGLVNSEQQDVVSRLKDACKKQRKLEFELETAVEQVKILQALLNSRKSKYESPRNFENRVRSNSKMMNRHNDLLIIESFQRNPSPSSESKGLVLSSFNLDSVSSQGSGVLTKTKGPRKSVWGTLSSSSGDASETVDPLRGHSCGIDASASETDLGKFPPQIPTKTPIVRLGEYFNSNPSKSTVPINLIATWVPNGGPRPTHLTPVVPGRETEDTSSGGKKIVFTNKLFKRKGFVDWDRFSRVDEPFDSSAMAFLFESANSDSSANTSRISIRSTARTARGILPLTE